MVSLLLFTTLAGVHLKVTTEVGNNSDKLKDVHTLFFACFSTCLRASSHCWRVYWWSAREYEASGSTGSAERVLD